MEKKHIEHFFENTAKMDRFELFGLTLPITLIYKNLFNLNEQLFKDKYDLLHSDIDVLAALYFNGKVLSPTELYDATVFSSGGMTKILKKLESLEYITRVGCENDKRSTLVQLEQKGEKLLLDCLDKITMNRKETFEVLTCEEKDELKRILEKITLNLF